MTPQSGNEGSVGRVVCLGEALVDFVCERPVESLAEADAFVPRQGGSLANIAVTAARFGARAEIVGGAGDDAWGRWLRSRIAAEAVGVERFRLREGVGTSHAFVAVGHDGEPSFSFYGDPALGDAYSMADVEAALAGDRGVFVVGSDTLVGEEERTLTLRAAKLARAKGWEVLCDPNLRPARWASPDEMAEAVTALVRCASLVKLNAVEAGRLGGCNAVDEAAVRLREKGPETVVVTLGALGALIVDREGARSAEGLPAELVDATGAGDCVAGVIAAGLTSGAGIDRSLRAAMAAASCVVSAWGATDGLPDARRAQALLAA